MRLFLLVCLTMVAFAANSILNRLGVAHYGMDPMDFAAIRVAAGSVMLWMLVLMRAHARPKIWSAGRLWGALSLAIYMIGFSWAYISLGAGLGALILFGSLQVVIFGWAAITGQEIPLMRWIGALVALIGLVALLWPGGQPSVPALGAASMVAAGVGWAAYTLLGRGEADALGATAANFLLCIPLTSAALLIGGEGAWTTAGVTTAIAAGAVTSGLGYALWYRVLPQLQATVAGIAQLSVPVIAVAAGAALLGEAPGLRLVLSGALVLGGIGLSLIPRR